MELVATTGVPDSRDNGPLFVVRVVSLQVCVVVMMAPMMSR
jgi:hypothetical protein